MFNDYSLSLMKKYGWKEGEGLGKRNQGISKPVRANLKFNNLGIGFQEVKVDQDSKWSNMYSSALSRIGSEKNDKKIIPISANEQKLNIFGYSSLLKGFRKSDIVIKDGKEINISEEKSEIKKSNKRKHEKIKNDEKVDFISETKNVDKKSKKKKTVKEINVEKIYESIEVDIITETKKSKKKNNLKEENVKNIDESIEVDIITETKKSKKKKSLKEESAEKIDEGSELGKISSDIEKSKKKKKSKESVTKDTDGLKNNDENASLNKIYNGEDFCESKVKTKKKKTKTTLIDVDNLVMPNSSFMTCHPSARFGIGMSGKLARIQKLYESEKANNQLKGLL